MSISLDSRFKLCDKAADHMREALAHLDRAGATRAAALLDHALTAVPGVVQDGVALPNDGPAA